MHKHLRLTFSLVVLLQAQSCFSESPGIDVIVTSIRNTTRMSEPASEICREFTLSKQDVANYFLTASEVSDHEFNRDAVILPCRYEGTLKLKGSTYRWEIAAGGTAYLDDGKGVSKRFLCKEKCCRLLPDICSMH